jgi:hypothetical protein
MGEFTGLWIGNVNGGIQGRADVLRFVDEFPEIIGIHRNEFTDAVA